jgi:hypothetical protein
MNQYCLDCGHFRLLDAASFLCSDCADTWVRVRAAEALEAA